LSPFPRGGVSGDVKRPWRTLKEVDEVNPFRAKAGEPYKKSLMEGGLCPESIASSPYRGRPWRGWMSLLVLFSAPEKRTKMGFGGIPQREASLRCVFCFF
jgi:hypothetical protein